MTIEKKAHAHWSGSLKEGKGHLSTQSGALRDQPYGFMTRFEDKPGTNPEELLGAAHAGCFTMALSMILGEAGLTATSLDTEATVSLEKMDDGYTVTHVHLHLTGKVPHTTQKQFEELAHKAKEGCPVSRLFNTKITLDAQLD